MVKLDTGVHMNRLWETIFKFLVFVSQLLNITITKNSISYIYK
jgi:hypothetical protein